MLTQGVKVLILDAVDAKAAGGIVSNAKSQNVPVVAYDRLATGPVTYYVSYDNKKVGATQGQALLDALTAGGDPKRGQIVMINGSPTDPNAADFKAGAHSVLDGKVNIGAEYDTPDWSPDKAQTGDGAGHHQARQGQDHRRVRGQRRHRRRRDRGHEGRRASPPLPPVTGQDAELAAIQRILSGEQAMTVYKAIKPEAERGRPDGDRRGDRQPAHRPDRRPRSTTAPSTSRRCC